MLTCEDCTKPFVRPGTRGKCPRFCRPCAKRRCRLSPRGARSQLRSQLKYRYNITLERYDEMLVEQGGVCAICREGVADSVDHDHACCAGDKSCGDCVRGRLCRNCNSGIGQLHDDPALLRAAIEYLEERSRART